MRRHERVTVRLQQISQFLFPLSLGVQHVVLAVRVLVFLRLCEEYELHCRTTRLGLRDPGPQYLPGRMKAAGERAQGLLIVIREA
jgi:hypothetical protein